MGDLHKIEGVLAVLNTSLVTIKTTVMHIFPTILQTGNYAVYGTQKQENFLTNLGGQKRRNRNRDSFFFY